MKTSLAALLCTATFIAGTVPFASAADTVIATPTRDMGQTVYVDGPRVYPTGYNIADNNYFKLRDVAYLLRNSTAEFEVGWEKSTNVITLTTGKNYTAVGGELNTKALSSAAGKPTTAIVKVNGKKVSFDGYIINGNNYYKIADMAAALGFTADYDVPSRTVSL